MYNCHRHRQAVQLDDLINLDAPGPDEEVASTPPSPPPAAAAPPSATQAHPGSARGDQLGAQAALHSVLDKLPR